MVVNADDFGLDGNVNRAVLESFERGYCSDTTIMPNMPGFEEACELAHERGLAHRVGVHLVLTDGLPLTEEIRRCRRFCNEDGAFVLRKRPHVWRLSASETTALRGELGAQVAACRRRGIPISHADSHEHVHEEWAIASVVVRLCLEEGIPHVRIARNCGPRRSLGTWAYRKLANLRLRRAGLAWTNYFGSAEDYRHLLARRGVTPRTQSAEVMIHPMYDASGVLVDRLSQRPLADCADLLRLAATGPSARSGG
ncbi:MAG TPA: ChbG/HpnK family deacetylase [Planctomycetota bacterium]|nr:ChbG/HpnK family deacetylase [Planctomycetota bacterium]HRR80692.1 ChbG/HpnK family deacetylase [Planctomycetota bacterium]HRT93280.1 ChbG/HpnK family deacetylase [Planctomycetota bacterium]